ncbi:MAG TPA: P1 family peptidase, partial [Streptosporangiaceae bacterium]
MPRVTDLGIRVGLLPAGATDSVLDVPGVGLGHATVWRDEPPPPAGRGVARTGVTVLDPGGDLFSSPVPAGGAVLNGAGECTGFITAAEWGSAETPVYLTSTLQLGRVYDSACRIELDVNPACA